MPDAYELMGMLRAHAAQLAEHCVAVHITAVIEDDGDSLALHVGEGNFHAQYGAVREWLMGRDAVVRQHARRDSESHDASDSN